MSTGRALSALAGISAGLARLRRVEDGAAMIRRAPGELCRSLGFERAIVFQVEGDYLVAQSLHLTADPAAADALLVELRTSPTPLDDLPFESEIVRRRESPLLGEVVAGTRRVVQLPRSADAVAYASAPVLSGGRVAGFLHADRAGQPDEIDEFDHLALSVFAEGFGCAYERAVLRERLRAGLDDLREATATTDQLFEETIATELELDLGPRAPAPRGPDRLLAPPPPGDQRLSRREAEVIHLIAGGETNAGIAARLLISESTVKSHVKHILRKLDATHRAEAVSHYLGA